MTLDYAKKGELKVNMDVYLKGVSYDFPGVIPDRSATSSVENLFEVRPDESRILLDEKRVQAFHNEVAQLLCVSSRARKDIQTIVALLMTRVKSPGEDDWGEVKWVIIYIRSTINMLLIIRADGLNIVEWWVDASFPTHKDCQARTGATMSLG
jgi:hypothetical protein